MYQNKFFIYYFLRFFLIISKLAVIPIAVPGFVTVFIMTLLLLSGVSPNFSGFFVGLNDFIFSFISLFVSLLPGSMFDNFQLSMSIDKNDILKFYFLGATFLGLTGSLIGFFRKKSKRKNKTSIKSRFIHLSIYWSVIMFVMIVIATYGLINNPDANKALPIYLPALMGGVVWVFILIYLFLSAISDFVDNYFREIIK